MPDTTLRSDLWFALLTAEMNERYWGAMIHRYTLQDKGTRFGVALISSGTAASLVFTAGQPWMWKVVGSLAAAGNIYLPIVDHKKQIEELSEVKCSWAELRVEYERLWRKRKNPGQADVEPFDRLRNEEAQRTPREAKFGEHKKLIATCEGAVLRARGMLEDAIERETKTRH